MTGLAAAIFMAASCGQGTPVSATWSLDTAGSSIAFASIKAGELIESHTFAGLSGKISPDGEAEIDIPLDQVETKIDLRNERMREMFFETGTYPVATINASVDPEAFADLPVGGRTKAEITGELSLHGVEAPVYADVFVTRIGGTRIEVASTEPVVVNVSEFNLDNGLERLREVAGLPSITPASPVTFTFVFEAEDE